MATLFHLLLAVALSFFLVYQARSLAFVLRSHRARAGANGPSRGRLAWLWTGIPILVVVLLAARSWVAVFDVERPAIASSGTALTSAAVGRPASAPNAP